MTAFLLGDAAHCLVVRPTNSWIVGLALIGWSSQFAVAQNAASLEEAGPKVEEITVTATRRAEPLSKVPISISAFTKEELDSRGARDFDDITRLSPGLNLTRSAATGANQVAIRGISSNAGSGTTGIYIDDSPIQVNNLGFGSGTAFPGLFDIERVEVLRGPQGTLFGAGSEGGTVRFIQTAPSLTRESAYVRAEAADLAHGSPTYEGGGAFGAPIIDDRLGFRVSAFYRHEGGYIDGVNGTYKIVDPTGSLYGNSVDFTRTSTLAKDINWSRTIAVRGALKWAPTDSFAVSPSVFYQKRHTNDGAGSSFDLSTSDPGSHDYSRQLYVIGNPAVNPQLNAMNAPNNAFGDDQFALWAVNLSWNLGPVQLISNTSYFDRKELQWYDFTKVYAQFYESSYFVGPDGVTSTGTYAPLGWKAMAAYHNTQGNFVQEVRLQSHDSSSPLAYVLGAFVSHNRQTAYEPINENFIENASEVGFYPLAAGFGYAAVPGGDPFGPGHTAAQNFFGADMLANAISFAGSWKSVDEELAGFMQLDYTLWDHLKLTGGVRVSHHKLDFDAAYLGPENNANAPFGFPCPDGGYCPFGSGTLTPSYPTSAAHSAETATTPKFGISYRGSDANMVYATASKGFRPAGASLRVPSICDSDLRTNGYVDAAGNPTQPTSYKSDTVWAYELGSKNRLFNGRLVLDASVYQINWRNIQTNVGLPNCAYNFVDNLADATSRGFDFAFQAAVTQSFNLNGAVGYNNPKYDRDAVSPGGVVVQKKGTSILDAGAPFTLSLSGEQVIPLAASRQAYARLDYTHTSKWRAVNSEVPDSPFYDPLLRPVPAYDVVNLRLGARFSGFDLSVFVQNLTNSAPNLAPLNSHSTTYDPQDWRNTTLRPRTFGVTGTWRQ
jgi:outer membrane receptor protein involved in Fe transport